MSIEITIGSDRGGCYVEWYNNDNDSYSRWYGTPTECVKRAQGPVPSVRDFRPIASERNLDAATATGMYDP